MPAKSIIQMPDKAHLPDNDKAFRENGLFKQQTAFLSGAYAKGQLAKAPFPRQNDLPRRWQDRPLFQPSYGRCSKNAERPFYLVEQAAAYESAGIAFVLKMPIYPDFSPLPK